MDDESKAKWDAFFRGSKYEEKWLGRPPEPVMATVPAIGEWWERLSKERKQSAPLAEQINPFGSDEVDPVKLRKVLGKKT